MTDEDVSEVLHLMRQIAAALEGIDVKISTQVTPSHVEIKTSTRGVDISVKSYVGSPIREAGDAAMDEYLRVGHELERRLMGGAAA